MFLRITAAVLLALFALAHVAPARAADLDPTPLEVFRRHFRDRSPEVRLKAVSQLAGQGGAGVVEGLLAALEDEDRRVRERAGTLLREKRDTPEEIDAFARIGLGPKRVAAVRGAAAHGLARAGPKALPHLRKALDDRQTEVRAVAALGIGAARDVDSAPALSAKLADREALVRAAAGEALGVLLDADAVGTASAVLLGDRATEPCVAAAEILGRHPRAGHAEHLGRGLGSMSWSVRIASARAFSEFGATAEEARAAAPLLVKALEREERERVRQELAAALFALTGIDFGPDRARWTAWFSEVGTTFEPPARRPVRASLDPRATRGHLLDLPLESEHVAFVLDNSHSMLDPIRFGVETTKRAALVGALEAVLARLPRDSWVNLIPFGTEPDPFRPALVAATAGVRRDAVRFMEKHVPDGRTNIFDSLELALRDPEVDTIVLVTDGAPTEGRRRSRTDILAGIRELNRYRLARIHAIEIGAKNTSPRWRGFMKEIADATGGHHLER